jgi:hypothetical protein
MKNRLCVGMILSAAVMLPSLVRASESGTGSGDLSSSSTRSSGIVAPVLSIEPTSAASTPTNDEAAPAATTDSVNAPTLELDAGGTASRLHGFGSFSINSQYITPRGLVALDRGPQLQALVGLVFDIYHGDGPINGVSLNIGTWGDFNSHPNASVVTGADVWCEEDFFTGFDVKFLNKWDFSYSIEAWTFPDISTKNEADPTTEYNMEFKVGFDDSEYLKAFAVHPYVNVFWNYAGASSPVVAQVAMNGKNDHTAYVEVGGAPSYTWKGISNMPITFSMPTYVSFGDSSFWGPAGDSGKRSNLGVLSTGLKVSVPLPFIPSDFGNWNAYVGVTYIYTANPGLSWVNDKLDGTGSTHDRVLGSAGLGFSF